jgi:hypothetical protein
VEFERLIEHNSESAALHLFLDISFLVIEFSAPALFGCREWHLAGLKV